MTFIQAVSHGQALDRKTDVENIFNSLRRQGVIGKTFADNPSKITSFQFEGDYSREKVFPNIPTTTIICVSPITFESPIQNTLRQIDRSYDSVFYQKQIQDSLSLPWSKMGFEFATKIRFGKSGFLRSEIGMISYPLFSKDGQIATITYGTISGNSVIKQREKVYFLRRNEKEWTVIGDN